MIVGGRRGLKQYLRNLRRIKELFEGSLPVFVAAAISRSSVILIELVSNTNATATWITFAYASS